MNIVINTNYEAAATVVCVHELTPLLQSKGHHVVRNDWTNYKDYDLAMFMTPDSEVQKAKQENGMIKTCIIDPKISTNKHKINEIKNADFIIVGSIEQQDALLELNENSIIYYMFPTIRKTKNNYDGVKTIIGYHGNKLHLHSLSPIIINALYKISKEYEIEFWAMYNIKALGKWKTNLSESMVVRHIQWSNENYYKYLSNCNIGIVNNLKPFKLKPFKFRKPSLIKHIIEDKHGYDYSDNILRFKYNTNPGRIYVFSQMHVAVISDFVPSSVHFITNNFSGLLANSEYGWYLALKKLIENKKLREYCSTNLYDFINTNYSIEANFEKLHDYINYIIQQ